MWVVQDCDRFNGPSTKCRMCYVKQSVVLTGRNTTGPPSHAAPWLVTLHRHGVLQTTSDANEQNNTPPPYTVCRRASIKAVCVCVLLIDSSEDSVSVSLCGCDDRQSASVCYSCVCGDRYISQSGFLLLTDWNTETTNQKWNEKYKWTINYGVKINATNLKNAK